jgi:shikimate dehydrogenase
MSSLFDFTPKTDRYALLGNPVAHSKSPLIHAAFARQLGHKIEYHAIQVDTGGFAQAVGNFEAAGGKGINVTLPFKHEAFTLCDELSSRARLAQAVNTILFKGGGKRFGDNTDGVGLIRDIVQNHRGVIAGRRVLLLGAGGAAHGALGPLLEEKPAQVFIANRTPDKALELAHAFQAFGAVQGGSYADLAGRQADLIINATSASLQGAVPPLPDGTLAPGAWCYDMMYAAAPTAFVRWGEKHGAAKSLDGLGMLVEQAAESFYVWRGVRPATAPVIELLRVDL